MCHGIPLHDFWKFWMEFWKFDAKHTPYPNGITSLILGIGYSPKFDGHSLCFSNLAHWIFIDVCSAIVHFVHSTMDIGHTSLLLYRTLFCLFVYFLVIFNFQWDFLSWLLKVRKFVKNVCSNVIMMLFLFSQANFFLVTLSNNNK